MIYKVIELDRGDKVLRMTTEDKNLAYQFYWYCIDHGRKVILVEKEEEVKNGTDK